MPADVTVHIIDGYEAVRRSLAQLFAQADLRVRTYVTASVFLAAAPLPHDACIVADLDLPDMTGFDLLRELANRGTGVPVVIATARGTIPLAVEAMRAGAADFLEKPLDGAILLKAVRAALDRHRRERRDSGELTGILARIESLSARERQVLEGLVAGHPNKIIAYELGISIRTIEIYRANVMTKMKAASLSDLVRMAIAGGISAARKKAG